jgi:hypothetical protein
MKNLQQYITESAEWMQLPAEGDVFAIELPDEVICETYILEVADNCILLDSTDKINQALSEFAILEDTDEGESGVIMESIQVTVNEGQMKELMWRDAERMTLDQFVDKYGDEDWVREFWNAIMGDIDEAKYQGREVALSKPMQGDVKKFKVYVKDPVTGNVKKVNFGDKTMRIKKSNPARRKSFRARHNCANPGPRTKARYWSCRKW